MHWLIDWEPRNWGFYTGLTELTQDSSNSKRNVLDSGHLQRLYTFKNLKNRHVQSKTHGVADFEYFRIEFFAMILWLNSLTWKVYSETIRPQTFPWPSAIAVRMFSKRSVFDSETLLQNFVSLSHFTMVLEQIFSMFSKTVFLVKKKSVIFHWFFLHGDEAFSQKAAKRSQSWKFWKFLNLKNFEKSKN